MATIGDRISERMRELGIRSKAELGRLADVSRTTSGAWTEDDHGISYKNLLRLARVLRVHHEWLATGQPPKLLDEKVESLGDQLALVDMVRVPLISWVQAGHWSEIVANFPPGNAEEWVNTTARVGEHAFALRVNGDSMEPLIQEGSVVTVDPDVIPTNGCIVVARLAGSEATLKRLVIDGPRTYLAPENPKYPMIPVDGELAIVGVAVKVELDLPQPGGTGRPSKAKNPYRV